MADVLYKILISFQEYFLLCIKTHNVMCSVSCYINHHLLHCAEFLFMSLIAIEFTIKNPMVKPVQTGNHGPNI